MQFAVMNGYCPDNFAGAFAGDLEDVVMQVAEGTMDKADLKSILEQILEQYLQSLKPLKQDKAPALNNNLHNQHSQTLSTPQTQ
ncbi:hypothetical protein [Helicobacter suis]|uniref:hypothetical protein n=1 Tax=Helicobacter suis TaxID=104628 RepID=UPI001F0788CD|nr:hypothetical protein [Helicobacter suis]